MARTAADYRELSVSERIQLVEDIWDSIAMEAPDSIALLPAQAAELRRRIAELEADPSIGVPWEKLRAELFLRES